MFQFPDFTSLQKRAIYLVLALALSVGAIFFSLAHGNAAATPAPTSSPLPTYSVPPLPLLPPATIVVDVAGKVLHPGVYRLKQGSRVVDAIKAAGKQLKGVALTDINLAEVLTDGQQIIIGAPPISTATSKSKKSGNVGASKAKITKGTININTATVTEYERLPGVGAVMAGRIFAYRTAHGPFATIDDLAKVSGMGKSKFANLKSFVRT
jgi:competence protein ComEA